MGKNLLPATQVFLNALPERDTPKTLQTQPIVLKIFFQLFLSCGPTCKRLCKTKLAWAHFEASYVAPLLSVDLNHRSDPQSTRMLIRALALSGS